MTGFQIFLTILFGIVALIVLILSIPVKVSLGYDDKIHLSIKYLFIKMDILPTDPNKPQKEKKPKEEKVEKPKEEETTPKEKRPNPILEMVKANGYDGMMEILGNLGRILKKYGGKLFKSIVFDEAYIYVSVGTGDAASTAIKYGKTCQQVYPLMGFICNNNIVRKYDVNVEPDFLSNNTQGEFFFDMNICLRKIINATLAMVVRLVFGVVIKFLQGGTKKPTGQAPQKPIETSTADAVK